MLKAESGSNLAAPISYGTTVANQGASNAPTVTGAQVQAAKPAAPNPNAYDYSGDPVLMQAKAFAAAANQQAQAQATARMQQLGIEYNDPSNPFSTVARIDRAGAKSVTDTNEAYNKQNLFYSGHRAKGLSELATALQQQKYDAANQYRAQTTDVTNNLASALLGNQQNVIGAEGDAYNRALQQALTYGINPGGASAGPTDFNPADTANLPQGSVAQGPIAPGATAPDLFAGLGQADPNALAAALKPAAPAAKPVAPKAPVKKKKAPALQVSVR